MKETTAKWDLPDVADMINEGIERAGKTHRQLAVDMGLAASQSALLTMMKKGDMRMPLSRLLPISNALNLDARVLCLAALKEKLAGPEDSSRYTPEAWNQVAAIIGNSHSDREDGLLMVFRKKEEQLGHPIVIDDQFVDLFEKFLDDLYTL